MQKIEQSNKGELYQIFRNVCVVLFLLRVARTLNQTGDKWLHLPDVSDYLMQPENKISLTALHVLSLVFLLTSRILHQTKPRHFLNCLISAAAYFAILIQKVSDGSTYNVIPFINISCDQS